MPADVGPGLWLTPTGVALVLEADVELVTKRLWILRDRRLICDDWKLPRAYARTLLGDCALFRLLGNVRSQTRAAA